MRPSGKRLNVGSSPTVGAVFSAMKAEYVVVAEQAHPLGPAYSSPYIFLLLHALIPCSAVLVYLIFSTVIPTSFNKCVYSYTCITAPQSLQKSKALIHSGLRQQLVSVNDAECELLEERWLSDECAAAIMQRKQ